MQNNGDCDTAGEVYGNSMSTDLTVNVEKNWQENSSQSNQHNGITISDQKSTHRLQSSQ